ncbi:Murein DD-endopeptidase MepM [termite gut metagenome]|uniref:Murein DD-endopeptidase MepM n=1 Tax=termite gut metagenome TaxID=433724 RepID=A0A5J4SCN3_9ZZZZ
MKRNYFKNAVILTGLSVIFSVNSFSQDLIAKQAPVDKTLKKVDSLALLNLMKVELTDTNPYASDLYAEWDNKRVHSLGDKLNIPDSHSIDLTGFSMPTKNPTRITSSFGPRKRKMHNGTDLKVYVGDTIVAVFDGKVRIVNTERRGYGNYVVIRHNNGLETIYGHLSKQLVKENQEVKAGEVIGLGGSTGRSTGSHLHFEVRFLSIAINPANIFNFQKEDIVADTYTFTKYKSSNKNTLSGAKVKTNDDDNDNDSNRVIHYHKVKKGDTLSHIALASGVSLSQLCKLNRITLKTIIRPGQVLRCS